MLLSYGLDSKHFSLWTAGRVPLANGSMIAGYFCGELEDNSGLCVNLADQPFLCG